MNKYALVRVDNEVLRRNLKVMAGRERGATADLLAHIAEFDERKLFVSDGFPSMHAYCVSELGLSEDAADKRINVARKARRFPRIFEAIADGRLTLSGVRMLASHLTEANADRLLAAAEHRTNAQIQELLVVQSPRSELIPWVIPVSSTPTGTSAVTQPAARRVSETSTPIDEHPGPLFAVPATAPTTTCRVAPLAEQRYGVQLMIGRAGYELLQYVQELSGQHNAQLGELFESMLKDRAIKLEKRKFAATERPSRRRRPTTSVRHIPAHVERAVWKRDGGQCTFVCESGKRCTARNDLQYDHIVLVAHGGKSTVDNVRLLCRAHNQHAAEQVLGVEFMRSKREAAQERALERRARAAAVARVKAEAVERKTAEEARAKAAEEARAAREARERSEAEAQAREEAEMAAAAQRAKERDIIPCLQRLGFRSAQAKLASQHCDGFPDDTLEQRVKRALAFLCPKTVRTYQPASGAVAAQ